jgi:hypothetical protein
MDVIYLLVQGKNERRLVVPSIHPIYPLLRDHIQREELYEGEHLIEGSTAVLRRRINAAAEACYQATKDATWLKVDIHDIRLKGRGY